MVRKSSALIRYKIGGLVLLLGIFGSFGTSAFASVCSDKNPANDGNTHIYTCQNKTNVTGLCGSDGTVDTTSSGCPSGFLCHRCVCPGSQIFQNNKCVDPTPTCTVEGSILSDDKKSCVCPTGKEEKEKKCVDKVSGPALGGCGKNGILTPDKTQCQCPDKSFVNFGVDCPTPPSTKTQTEEEKCLAKTGYQRNAIDQKCENCKDPGVCCGVKLNTNVPFVGRCITFGRDANSSDTTVVTEATAFPRLMGALTKIMTTFLLLICFGGILVGGVMVAASGGDSKRASEGKSLIGKVIMAIAVLGASGIILHLINPNFF